MTTGDMLHVKVRLLQTANEYERNNIQQIRY